MINVQTSCEKKMKTQVTNLLSFCDWPHKKLDLGWWFIQQPNKTHANIRDSIVVFCDCIYDWQ